MCAAQPVKLFSFLDQRFRRLYWGFGAEDMELMRGEGFWQERALGGQLGNSTVQMASRDVDRSWFKSLNVNTGDAMCRKDSKEDFNTR